MDTEVLSGPNYRVTVQQATGNIRMILQRWPVTQILAMQTSPNTFPRTFQNVPSGMFDVEFPVVGLYGSTAPSGAGEGGQSVLLAPGFGGWQGGRSGWRFSTTYLNGWPHAGLTVNASAGASSITVDDVTGFTGASAFIYDGSSTEVIQVSSVTANTPLVLPNGGGTAPAGPGVLHLAAPLTFAHTGSVPTTILVSSMPQNVLWAATLAATAQALEAGITSVTIQNIPGSMTAGGHGVSDIKTEYELLLEPFKRVI